MVHKKQIIARLELDPKSYFVTDLTRYTMTIHNLPDWFIVSQLIYFTLEIDYNYDDYDFNMIGLITKIDGDKTYVKIASSPKIWHQVYLTVFRKVSL